MSKNARRKKREKAHRRDQWSRFPKGTSLAFFISGVEPQRTPLLDMISRGLKHG